MVDQREDLDQALHMLRAYHDLIRGQVSFLPEDSPALCLVRWDQLHLKIDQIIQQVAIAKWGRPDPKLEPYL